MRCSQSKQRLSEYRNGIAKEAIDVVSEYLLSARFATAEDRASYVVWALGETYPFRYIRIVHEDDGTVVSISVSMYLNSD